VKDWAPGWADPGTALEGGYVWSLGPGAGERWVLLPDGGLLLVRATRVSDATRKRYALAGQPLPADLVGTVDVLDRFDAGWQGRMVRLMSDLDGARLWGGTFGDLHTSQACATREMTRRGLEPNWIVKGRGELASTHILDCLRGDHPTQSLAAMVHRLHVDCTPAAERYRAA